MPTSDAQPPTEQRQIADRFAAFILTNRLAYAFGGAVTRSRLSFDVQFSTIHRDSGKPIHGEVSIYSPRFLLVRIVGPFDFAMSRFYASEKNAMDFLRLLLVEHNVEEALALPVRITSER